MGADSQWTKELTGWFDGVDKTLVKTPNKKLSVSEYMETLADLIGYQPPELISRINATAGDKGLPSPQVDGPALLDSYKVFFEELCSQIIFYRECNKTATTGELVRLFGPSKLRQWL